ncbi:MAG: hypothetical protein SCALA701_30930 [Candidatus Scalindua sp.]|nr:MAG: hypothetical protein SCALA701_30930 [Candidatus Scalindua sp.]
MSISCLIFTPYQLGEDTMIRGRNGYVSLDVQGCTWAEQEDIHLTGQGVASKKLDFIVSSVMFLRNVTCN